jgi:peptidoglycan lytic transglycosylase G
MNRLANGMLLQVDAAVIYGMGDHYDGKIYKKNLLEETPYNTYLHKGLPPTPIAMPGLASLKASMNPEQNNFYYYVVKGSGAHEFSRTLDEQKAAVQLFHKK